MLEGNTFFPVTGMPIRKIACMMSPLAEADPVPLAVAILNAKSLVWFIDSRKLPSALHRRQRNHRGPGIRNLERELPHVPCVGRAPLRAQAAVQADVLALGHPPAGLLERAGRVERLIEVERRSEELRPHLRLGQARGNGEAVHRT